MSKSSAGQKRLRTGGCLCGGVRYEVRGPLRSVVNCHCSQCRRTHGHFAAYTAAPRENVLIHGKEHLKWYRSSDSARRGFCTECGSSLFWDPDGQSSLSIAAGTLDQPTGLETVTHVFMDDKPDYYTIDDNLEKRPRGLAD
ncbi:MAG: GFA family protein [Acidiferrobacterales bacterium]